VPQVVLVAVLKNKDGLSRLLEKKWYRIPVEKCPKRKFAFLAFFEPGSAPGRRGRIRYFAKPAAVKIIKNTGPKKYYKFTFTRLHRLKVPVANNNGLRVSFGFTTLEKLKNSKEVTGLFGVAPVEKILQKALKKTRLKIFPEYPVRLPAGKKYRLDFAVFCKKGVLNIECDSTEWHSLKSQIIKDKKRDETLKKLGWSILRLQEAEITGNISKSVAKVLSRVKTLGVMK